MINSRIVLALAATWMTAGWPAAAPAWGPEGHTIVADIAVRHLTPRARERMRAILGKKQLGDYEVSSWPDIIRGDKEYDKRYPKNNRWHYVDFNVFDHADELKLPEDEQDIVSQITRWHGELARPKLSRARRRAAVSFLVHFVGDLHQPLHCGYRYNDAGGNFIPIRSFEGEHFTLNDSEPMDHPLNLHSVWDECLVYELMAGRDPDAVARQLLAEITPEQAQSWAAGAPLDWAFESFKLAHDRAYHFADGSDIPFTWSRPGTDLTRENYIDAAVPVAREQLEKAGIRLAHLLNTALDPAAEPATGGASGRK
ncbi:MAG TPA: S1/P1 nuclease [Kiritimatiellia bacterium]|nr:S1/P1 nuclease [Kiritimatiellia bacterium]HRZ10945.1 S1/P1 nuclease [Kiritimatiellia bacterium]HSA18518.1 S1/P1 nuclease [Kiritimatiellia bacterium]